MKNGPVKSALTRTIKTGLAARNEVNQPFYDVYLERVKGVRDRVETIVWLESVLWVAEAFNRYATSINAGMLFPHVAVYGS